jgi:hypothetical protein
MFTLLFLILMSFREHGNTSFEVFKRVNGETLQINALNLKNERYMYIKVA